MLNFDATADESTMNRRRQDTSGADILRSGSTFALALALALALLKGSGRSSLTSLRILRRLLFTMTHRVSRFCIANRATAD